MQISSFRTALRRGALSAAALLVGSCSSTTDSIDSGDIASVVVNPSSTSVAVGAQVPLQATAAGADGKPVSGAAVVWTVKDSDIVSVSPAGVVTGLALGTTQVAANIGGKSGIAAITVQKTPVASVIVRPNHIDASTGAKTQLTAVAYDGGQNPLTDRAIIWSSSNTGVATVDPDGLVTATGPGTASITATAEGKNDVATITVTQAPVASVAVTPNPLSMSVGQTTGLTALLRDDAGNLLSGRPVEWSSSNTGVATISSSGSLTAVAAGTTTITATSEGKSGTAIITVTNFAVATVNVQPQNNTITQGSSLQLSATLTDVNGAPATNRAVAWSSSNTGVATVTSNGLVSGIATGSVTITATSEGKTGSASVTVQPKPVATVTVTPGTASLTVGQTTNLTVVLKDQNGGVLTGRTVVWTTSSSAVATVSSSGTVTAVGAGNATITATSEGKSGTASITVTAIPVGSVTVSPPSTTVPATTTVGLNVVVKDVNGTVVTDRVVTWTTSNAAAATVSSSGVVTGVAIGTATITATSETKSGSATVNVTQAPVSTVTITPPSPTVVIGTTTTLSAITRDANGVVLTGRAVTWSSSNPAVAAVTTAGAVTGVSTGTATITATSEGKSGTASVAVVPVPVATVAVSPLSANVVVGGTQQLVAVTKDASNNTLSGRIVTWSTSSTAIATVSTAGVVTGVAPGTATITATSEGKSGTATIFVSQVPVASITVSPSPATVAGTQTIQLTATVKDQNGVVVTDRTVSWSTNNSSVAMVSPTGLTAVVTGNNTGNVNVSATITATSETKSVGTNVTVTPNPVATVTVSPSPASVKKNDKVTLTATPRDANNNVLTGRAVTWSSSNTNVATVSASGEVTGKNSGTAVITATIGGVSGTSTVTVTP
ncbi:MAG TPA: Ig-like domain-containing protein [Gemmatimonadaceae bacterium]|jgi:uncharacterized protein YjdB|nr:Ig-like domain-containing protein [Gemmatimonadaceae bacterium]